MKILAEAPAGRKALIYVSNGYQVDASLRGQIDDFTALARAAGVIVFAIDPRGQSDDLAADPIRFSEHLTATRESLRMVADASGGFLILQLEAVAAGLKRMGDMVRR